jgi:hypothetical protein
VINRSGEPVLQVASAIGRYADQDIDEEALRELIAGQDKTREQRGDNRGKSGPRHTAKNRRTKASRNSSGRSSPMATDQEDGPTGPTVSVGSSNAVPQGPQRKTTNLESASLRKQASTTENTQFQPREAARQAALSRQQRQRASPPPQPQRQQQPRRQSPPRSEPQPQYEHQPQPQPQPLPRPLPPQHRPEGHTLAVPQPGGGLRRMAPPQQVANMPYGQQWYPVNQAYPGPPMALSSDFSNHGGPVYVPYSSMGQAGPSGYGEGHYGPPTPRYTSGQQLPVGGYRNSDM